MLISVAALGVVLVLMLAELRVSRRNEQRLLERGAHEPKDRAFTAMRLAYPGTFVAMAFEGAWVAASPGWWTIAGIVIFAAAKALKYWAVVTLGPRWTYRILVPPAASLVATGPYVAMRHPNYVGVVGELIGMALIVGARIAGPISIAVFGWLLWLRVADEERAHRSLSGVASTTRSSTRRE